MVELAYGMYELALEQRMVGQQTKYEASLLLWGVPAKRDGVLSDKNLQKPKVIFVKAYFLQENV